MKKLTAFVDFKRRISAISCLLFCLITVSASFAQTPEALDFYQCGRQSLDRIHQAYAVPDGKFLYRENYPNDEAYTADYLGGGANANRPNPYAYLWPFSGTLSAHVALLEVAHDTHIKKEIDQRVLPGLANYLDNRAPAAYASYINEAPVSDRFYDDNIWLGIDLADLYLLTKERKYLKQAEAIWQFILSGTDDKLGGGIYWCEQRKESKNTCSNAPGAVLAAKLYEATRDSLYLNSAKELYAWTKKNLQDPEDALYWDNVSLGGKIEKTKHAYNTGQMVQAAALLYKLTKKESYLIDAQRTAAAGFDYFFHKDVDQSALRTLKNSNVWFLAVMMRGYVELYALDQNPTYINSFRFNLTNAWHSMRAENGLFGKNWSGQAQDSKKWLLDQFAIVEMYAKLASLRQT
ncbi:glycoside hydrolase family 76 protein [Sphingobacterium oryzagri]|uniref:Glycoside hydrolase family 76 protein n=1 Tax=Sphingobacterium oryzagri TaxID=3025669 RepID=A0ABY7WFC7_9SPHI|nr:glycoside hydrolase family 76 protein [Sphingobacterium sp. KACC 22765]WDF68326.1 glycoside hydrolase family 76 protein [Sphingobacterium sp. KACC 22765]